MADNQTWLLPDGIYESLPEEAAHFEQVRRELLDLFRSWGYQLVMPPMVEFMESLATGTGNQLDLQTFKVTDQLTGRLMGVRADITPQVARLDAHRMRKKTPNRLCYFGPVLRTRSNHANRGSRSPLQIGAELFGHAGLDSDVEVISLALKTLDQCDADSLLLDLGHVGVFSAIVNALGLDADSHQRLSDMLNRKSVPEIKAWVEQQDFSKDQAEVLLRLPELHGDASMLGTARELVARVSEEAAGYIAYVDSLVAALSKRNPQLKVHIDFAELRGYAYHTGMVFEIYVSGMKREVIRGGRYDGIGKAFGNARPATGFSTDLRILAALRTSRRLPDEKILAPADQDESLEAVIQDLRGQGYQVIRQLQGQQCRAQDLDCQKILQQHEGQWVVTEAQE